MAVIYCCFQPWALLSMSPLIENKEEDKEINSYKGVSEEVDVGVPPVIKGCVNRTEHPGESLGDQPGIAVTFRVLSVHLVILIVVPPELSTWMQKQQNCAWIHSIKATVPSVILSPTFKKVNGISFSGPHMHIRIHSVHGNSTPANLQSNRIPKARSVISVLIQPVPAVSHKVGVKADDHLPIGRLLLSDPIKHCAESSFTASWVQNRSRLWKT